MKKRVFIACFAQEKKILRQWWIDLSDEVNR